MVFQILHFIFALQHTTKSNTMFNVKPYFIFKNKFNMEKTLNNNNIDLSVYTGILFYVYFDELEQPIKTEKRVYIK